MDVSKEIFEIQNWVAHNLAGAVVGYVASTVYFVKRGVDRFQFFFRNEQIFDMPALSEGVNVRVLYEQEMIWGNLFQIFPSVFTFDVDDILKKKFLVIPGFFIIDKS